MGEITSIKVEKSVLKYLTSIKGYYEYMLGRKISYNSMITILCYQKDLDIAFKEKKIKLKSEDIDKYLEERGNFFGIKPTILDIGDNILKEELYAMKLKRDKTSKNSKK